MTSFTITSIDDITDSAAQHGLGELGSARFGRGDVDAEQTGFAVHHLKPGRRQGFGHRHGQAEEVCVVLAGSGRVRLDDETVELRQRDVLRIAPTVARRFEAGDDGLEFLVFGQHFEGDGELLPEFWAGE
jgi:mannose-6-phosphate isomerase-like protein (cupin superfamily)